MSGDKYTTCKPLVGRKIRTERKKALENLKRLGFECPLLPNTEYMITEWNEEKDIPVVDGKELTHRAMYTVLRNK